MTDEQILVQLAERVQGWKIHFRNTALYVLTDEANGLITQVQSPVSEWHPLTDWTDAMALAEKWAESRKAIIQITRFVDGEWRCRVYVGQSWCLFDSKSGPRAVTLAVARAAGIKTEGENDG